MTSTKKVLPLWQREQVPSDVSQYLKIRRSSIRFLKLNYLAKCSGCNWQTIAREAIDRLLENELGEPD